MQGMNDAEKYKEELSRVGFDVEERRRSASYLQVDNTVILQAVKKRLREKGVLVEDIAVVAEKHPWAKRYLWKLLEPGTDEYTAKTVGAHGYFIYVPPGVKVEEPVQACLFLKGKGVEQLAHNVIVVDDNAELNVVTGCVAAAMEGLHVGVTEMYVGRNAKLSFTMIHSWAPRIHVRPRTAVLVERNGVFNYLYINFNPVASIQAYPKIKLLDNAVAYASTILVGLGEAFMDLGTEIELAGRGARGEIASRAVARDTSRLIMRARMLGKAPDTKGHIDCKGLMLGDESVIQAVPELYSTTSGAELTHEAAIGKIAEEAVAYLRSKGFTEEEAVSMIIRGFMSSAIKGLPEQLEAHVKAVLDTISRLARG